MYTFAQLYQINNKNLRHTIDRIEMVESYLKDPEYSDNERTALQLELQFLWEEHQLYTTRATVIIAQHENQPQQ